MKAVVESSVDGKNRGKRGKVYVSQRGAVKNMDKILERIYLFLISDSFPLWLTLIFFYGFIIDMGFTFQVAYNDKLYFLVHESNTIFKHLYENNQWYLYSIISIILYSIAIIVSMKIKYPIVRIPILLVGVLQLEAPLTWLYPPIVSVSIFILVASVLYLSVYRHMPKIKVVEALKGNASF